MKNNNKNLYYLEELSDYKVADDYCDVRDWDVIDADQRTIGKVTGLLVNKEAERVVYLDVEVDSNLIEAGHETYSTASNNGVHEFLNADGENHLIIPIGMVTLDQDNKKVHSSQINYTTFTKTKRFASGNNLERSYELMVLSNYSVDTNVQQENDSDKQFYNRNEFNPTSSRRNFSSSSKKRTINDLIGFTLAATDGDIGKVEDFYFDDLSWTVRYLVVETGGWLSNRKVLISPESLLQCDWENEKFPVNLTKEQIEKSPNIETNQPVSRQQEIELYTHYPWTNYWGSGDLFAMGTSGMIAPSAGVPMEEAVKSSEINTQSHTSGDPHLRSAKNLQGYTIHASDDHIGDLQDFIVNDGNWTINYIVIDTGDWLPGKKVILSPKWIRDINWETSEVNVNASVEQIKNSPEYDHSQLLSPEYEEHLDNYYKGFNSHK